MRKNMVENAESNGYKILAVDDEQGIVDSLSIFLKRSGYDFTGVTDPVQAIELVKNEHFDMLILDFMMYPLHGDQVVEEIRKFNKELYILLLTGHKDLAPPLETIRKLDIQGYCEKSDKFDQLLLLIESGIKSIEQMNEIKKINAELKDTQDQLEKAFLESIQTLRYTVEAKDPYTRGHSDRVSEYSVLIGKKLGHPIIGAYVGHKIQNKMFPKKTIEKNYTNNIDNKINVKNDILDDVYELLINKEISSDEAIDLLIDNNINEWEAFKIVNNWIDG